MPSEEPHPSANCRNCCTGNSFSWWLKVHLLNRDIKSTGVSRTTISSELKELNNPDLLDSSRIRKKGGGRKKAVEKLPAIEEELQKLIEPALRGEPDSPLMWTSKSLRKLSAELKSKGFNCKP